MKRASASSLAYFLTFTTYGTHLIGHKAGSVDKTHNQYGTPFVAPNTRRESKAGERMRESVYYLTEEARTIVLKAVLHACRRYGWHPWAIHVRTNHVHTVVTAPVAPDVVLSSFKSFATRALNESGIEMPRKRRWTEKGSKQYIWTEEQLNEVLDYVVNRKGRPMEVWTKEKEDEEE